MTNMYIQINVNILVDPNDTEVTNAKRKAVDIETKDNVKKSRQEEKTRQKEHKERRKSDSKLESKAGSDGHNDNHSSSPKTPPGDPPEPEELIKVKTFIYLHYKYKSHPCSKPRDTY